MVDESEQTRPDWRPRIMEPAGDREERPEDAALRESLCRTLQPPRDVRERLYRFVATALSEQGIDPMAPGRPTPARQSANALRSPRVWWLTAAAACLLICAGLFLIPGGKDPFVLEVVQAAEKLDPMAVGFPIAPERTDHCYCAVLEDVRTAIQRECHIPELEAEGYRFEGADAAARLGGQRAVTLVYRHRVTGQPLFLHLVWDVSVSFRRAEFVATKSPGGEAHDYWVETEEGSAVVCWREGTMMFALVLPAPAADDLKRREASLSLAKEIRNPRVLHSLPS